jgi:predicted GH43/DUF377 family glycosyl hydrolase
MPRPRPVPTRRNALPSFSLGNGASGDRRSDTPSRRRFLGSICGAAALGLSRTGLARCAAASWQKSSANPILSLGPEGAFDSQNIFAPAVAKDGGQYYLFYSGGPSGPKNGGAFVRYQLGLARSHDGVRFTKQPEPLLPLGHRDNFHATPALLRTPDGGLCQPQRTWHMVYCGNRADDVEHATSRDGLIWNKDARSPVFRRAYAPNLLQVGGAIWMYYVHKPRADVGPAPPWEIHLATGADWYSLQPHPANPMLTLGQSWERGHLFYPYVLQERGAWVMFYASYWSARPARTAIGMARSPDGLRWEKHAANPVVTPTTESAFDSNYTSSQSVLHDGDHYKMYYAARNREVQMHKYYAICLATKRGPLLAL